MATMKQVLLFAAVLIFSSFYCQQAQANQTPQIVYVESTQWCQEDYQCHNFTFLQNSSATFFSSNTTIYFLHGSHFATASLTVSNITNLVLRGPEVSPDKSPVAQIIIKGERLYFENISNLTLECIAITSEQYNALQFHNIYSMVMGNMHIVGSYGYGLYAHSILGNLSITNCKFLNNSGDWISSDGGNAKITYDGFNNVKHNILQISHSEFGYGVSHISSGGLHIEVISTTGTEQYYLSVYVADCIFHDNRAEEGANMKISFHHNNADTRYLLCIISKSLFVSGHSGESGGGLYVEYTGNDNSTANVYIYNSTFRGNVAELTNGGGLSMSFKSNQYYICITMCTFLRNELLNYSLIDADGGGGIFLKLTTSSSASQNATKVVISNTSFEGNKAGDGYYSLENIYIGGGMHLIISKVVVEIENCMFNSNIAHSGSGVSILLQPSSTFTITECSFINGAANIGGAVSILVENDRDSELMVTILNSLFLNNSAILGGAVYLGHYLGDYFDYLYKSFRIPTSKGIIFLKLKGTIFYKNFASNGGAICINGAEVRNELSTTVDQCILSNNVATCSSIINYCQLPCNNLKAENSVFNIISNVNKKHNLWITNTQFSSNTVPILQYSTSTVYLLHVSECNISGTTFSNNSGSCLLAKSSNISLEGNVIFRGNTAFAGAAVLLDCPRDSLQPSFLNLLPNSTVIITNNTALHSGGGIAVNPDCDYDNHCFFQTPSVSGLNHLVHMDDNTAVIAGDSIYGPSIEPCTVANNISGNSIFATLFEVEQDVSNVIFAESYEVCFCGVDHVKKFMCATNTQLQVRSGQEFNISAVATWPLQELPSVSLIRSHLTTKIAYLGPLQDIQELHSKCDNLTFTVATTILTNVQIQMMLDFVNTTHSSLIDITILDCPVGFKVNNKSECDCDPYLAFIIQEITCDINTNTLKVPGKVWIGNYTNGKLLAHPYCSLDYCNPQTHSIDLQNQDQQCTSNRSGVLCGACQNGFSLTLGTASCLNNCSHFYFFLIIPFALAGVLLVLVLLKCNLTVSTGTVNSFIFYANIVHINSTIFFPKDKTILMTKFLSVFLAWINLDLGIETCFYKGMSAYANTWLQFVFPAYIWILVLIMIYSSRYYIVAAKLIGRNAVSVLATLFLLSYAKLLRTIIAAVSSIRVRDEDGTSHLLWLVDGNVPFLSGPHVALFVMAVLALLLYIIPLTLLTLLAPCLQARTNHWMMRWVIRIKPLLDAYQGPYKDKYRYWTGVMLIVRVILFTVFAANTVGNPSVNLFAIIVLNALIITFQAYQTTVYRSHLNSVLECFFNLNLCTFSTAILSLTSSERSSEYLACVMVGSSFVVFCCIILWHFNQQMELTDRVIDKIKKYAKRQRADDCGAERAIEPPLQRQAQPTVSVIDMRELREPLLTSN